MAISASEARKNLFPLIERVNDDHVPIEITSKHGSAVLMSRAEFDALEDRVPAPGPSEREAAPESLTQALQGERRFTTSSDATRLHADRVGRLSVLAGPRPRVQERINRLLEATLRDPFSGIGKPEQLRHVLQGAWSRGSTMSTGSSTTSTARTWSCSRRDTTTAGRRSCSRVVTAPAVSPEWCRCGEVGSQRQGARQASVVVVALPVNRRTVASGVPLPALTAAERLKPLASQEAPDDSLALLAGRPSWLGTEVLGTSVVHRH